VDGLTDGRTDPLGHALGDYELIAEAGSGGMGVVYRARQRSLSRIVALKVIREDLANDDAYRDRFLREARLVAAVDHPHVVSIFDVGEVDGRLFLAMQWIEGDDLARLLTSSERLAPERAVAVAIQLAGALDAVHSIAGLVHRDVKPANVLIRSLLRGDHAYLTDFGVARPSQPIDRLTQSGFVVGTAGYLSPEQIMGEEPGPRSDLYALGCVFFEALTGRPPFAADNEMALRWAHANNARPAASHIVASLDPHYDDFLEVALAVDPVRRFASGRAFANALAAAHTAAATRERGAISRAEPQATVHIEPTPTPAPPVYTAQGYGGPAHSRRDDRHQTTLIVLIVLLILVVVAVAVGVLIAAGAFSGGGGGAHIITPPGS
jgi:serine/threonine protein kinase